VLFSDLSNFTALTEKLDPEDVKDVIARIFKGIIRVAARYEGRIEKFIGDAAMILFGVPPAHEDDPVRALRAAFEIHRSVQDLNRVFQVRLGQPLSMHTGINTGLVVIGAPDPGSGISTVTGDAVNVAARLEGLSAPGEILVGPATYARARGYFDFDALAPARIKGKAEPLRIFRALGPQLRPVKRRPRLGRRSELIGRSEQMNRLQRLAKRLETGGGGFVSVCGEAGTGKSRLVQEFGRCCRSHKMQWIEAYAHAYTQNNPYALIIDLLHRAFSIRESDPPQTIKTRIENGLNTLMQEDGAGVAPYVAGLFSLSDPGSDAPGPEIWKKRLRCAVRKILNALADRAPTVICLEDLHWADPSSLELIRSVLCEFHPALGVICVHRPTLPALCRQRPLKTGDYFESISLGELAPAETLAMLKSLLQTEHVPRELRVFVEEKIGGNPFYLEEVINSLMEDGVLVRRNDGWLLTKEIDKTGIPPTIHGVITGRLDRMDAPLRRILQEAAVIGRTFFHEVLQKISGTPSGIDGLLRQLQDLDLIQVRSLRPHREYLFKHALTQEVVYRGLLKSERKRIHGRIGRIIEELFAERLSEFYESLAYHFHRSGQQAKAVTYLVKAGQKSTRRYALEEAHRYFEDAFHLLQQNHDPTASAGEALIEVLNHWAFVYYYRGRYRELGRLMSAHKHRAEALDPGEPRAMHQAWMGCALWHRERFQEAYPHLLSASNMAERIGNQAVLGYAVTWMVWTCTELGRFDEALAYAAKARLLCTRGRVDPYVRVNSMAGMGYALWHRGDKSRVFGLGRKLLRIGIKHADSRSRVMGYCCIGWSRLIDGDIDRSVACFRKAVAVSSDPWYSVFPQLALCYGLISAGKTRKAEALIEQIIAFSRDRGAEFAGTPAIFFRGILLISKGRRRRGLALLQQQLAHWRNTGCRLRYALCGCILAEAGARTSGLPAGRRPTRWLKGLGAFWRPGLPAAPQASACFGRYIPVAEKMGARLVAGRAYLAWGRMRQHEGCRAEAARCFGRALDCFQECGATGYIEQARDALRSLQHF
jgi:class 3 adenylate cyclase/tetratricopeptide (TPR) repeat protein